MRIARIFFLTFMRMAKKNEVNVSKALQDALLLAAGTRK